MDLSGLSQLRSTRSAGASPVLVPALVAVLAAASWGQGAVRLDLGGGMANDEFGAAVSIAGDLDGDGLSDILVGAPYDDSGGVDAGRVWVFSGADGSVIFTLDGSAGEAAGHSVGGGGDVNQDGVPDIVMGLAEAAPAGFQSGSARVHSGADGSLLYTFHGSAPDERFGYSCALAGDVNGDGHDDIIVGAPGQWNATVQPGYARVYSGLDGSVLHTFAGEAGGDRFGFLVRGGGDMDADGAADLLIGAVGADFNGSHSGRAYVFSGLTGALLYTFDGDAAGDSMGHGVSAAGDLNGDGRDDVLFAANVSPGTGYARIFSGLDGSLLLQLTGDSGFGHDASLAGDLNGDGIQDFAVGMPAEPTSGSGAGAARVFSGADGSVLATFFGDGPGDRFGYVVSGPAEVNGDGLADLVIGTSYQDGTPGYARVASVHAADPYGFETSPTQTLDLSWVPGPAGQVTAGTLVTSGAAPGSLGVLGASLAPWPATTLFGVSVYIDLTPGRYVYGFIAFSATGTASLPLDLALPALEGSTLYLQALELNPAAPQDVYASNALLTYFGP